MHEDLSNFGPVGDFSNGSENFRPLAGAEFCRTRHPLAPIMSIKAVHSRSKSATNPAFDIEFLQEEKVALETWADNLLLLL